MTCVKLHANLFVSVAKISIIWPSDSGFSKQYFSHSFSIQLELFTSDTWTREKSGIFSVATCIILYVLYLALCPGQSHLPSPARISPSPFNDCNSSLCRRRYLWLTMGERYFLYRLKFPLLKKQLVTNALVEAKWFPVYRIPPLKTSFPIAIPFVNGWEIQFSVWPPSHELVTQIRLLLCFRAADLTWAPQLWHLWNNFLADYQTQWTCSLHSSSVFLSQLSQTSGS